MDGCTRTRHAFSVRYPFHVLPACRCRPGQHDGRGHALRSEVWGIGRRIAAQLAAPEILKAWDVAQMPASKARRESSMVLELQGLSCISLEQAPSPKKQIASTRSFG